MTDTTVTAADIEAKAQALAEKGLALDPNLVTQIRVDAISAALPDQIRAAVDAKFHADLDPLYDTALEGAVDQRLVLPGT